MTDLKEKETIEKYINQILSDETEILKCLKYYTCRGLHEINNTLIPIEEKVVLSKELIDSSSIKDSSLAEVLNVISEFLNEE